MQVQHHRIHRIYRAGACPILEVTLTYPCLCSAEDGTEALSPAVTRFNEFYETVAERLLSWAEGTIREAAAADFAAEGSGASYRFDRRRLTCDMTVTLPPAEEGSAVQNTVTLTVTRTLVFDGRRGTLRERRLTAEDEWRWPELTLRPPKGRRR